jgi:hypothetical protein
MDVTKIQTVVQKQLTGPLDKLHSIQLQNHLYGCFILMEDLAQNALQLMGNIVKGPTFQFDMDQQFSTIGLRFGFVMDSKVAWTSYLPEYKEAWLQLFTQSYSLHDVDKVDQVEDALIHVIQQFVQKEDAYFVHALETGSLSHEWVDKVLRILMPSTVVLPSVSSPSLKPAVIPVVIPADIPVTQPTEEPASLLQTAKTEKPMTKIKQFSFTRRHKADPTIVKVFKKHGKTRRIAKNY